MAVNKFTYTPSTLLTPATYGNKLNLGSPLQGISAQASAGAQGISPAATSGALAGVTSLIGGILDAQATAAAASLQASAYRSNARLAITQANTQNMYLNEETAQQVWNLYDYQKSLLGQQSAAMAASGFTDVSAGDRRIAADTRRKTAQAASGLNRTAYLQSFENTRQAMMEASRLNYAARMSEIQGKSAKSFANYLNIGANAGLSALGAYGNAGGGASGGITSNVGVR